MTHGDPDMPVRAGNSFIAGAGASRLTLTVTEAGTLVGQTLGEYQLHSLIGTGGMAEVYSALDLTLMREVAVKVLPALLAADGDYVVRFRAEARRVGALNHPHIVPIYAYGEEQGLLYLVMPIERESLRERLAHQRALPPEEAVRLALQVASALEAAHALGIIHRDVKPENVLLSSEGNVLLTDFGIARDLASLRQEGTARTLASTGLPVGTPEYMAPEQLRGDAVDQRADVYALGAVLYELLVGKPPFRADTPYGVAALALTAPITPPSQANPAVWPALEHVVLTALARDPDTRYPDMGRLAKALRLALTRRSAPPVLLAADQSPILSPQMSVASHSMSSPRDTLADGVAVPSRHASMWPLALTFSGADRRSLLASRRNRLLLGLLIVVMLVAGSGSVALMLQDSGAGPRASVSTPSGDNSGNGIGVGAASPSANTTPAQATPKAPISTVVPRPTATATPVPPPALTISPEPLVLALKDGTCTAMQTITNNTQQTVGWSWHGSPPGGINIKYMLYENGSEKGVGEPWPADKTPGIPPGGHDTLVASIPCPTQELDFAVLAIDTLGNQYLFEVEVPPPPN